jgi:hypothetical protein
MTTDNPKIPEFGHYDSYGRSARRVRRNRRYATDTASRDFIATVLATAQARRLTIDKERILYRAQLGIREHESVDDDGETRLDILGYCGERMVPKAEFVTGGRANAARVAYLYLATTELTAI